MILLHPHEDFCIVGIESDSRIDAFAHWPVPAWPARLPSGQLERIYLHWSGYNYERVFTAYHYCIAQRANGEIVIVETHDLRANMRDIRAGHETLPYAAHTQNRNAYAAGIAVMGMRDARPDDFGVFPLTEPLIKALCLVSAHVARAYAIPIDADHIMTHAEAAILDNYFGLDPIEERWDLARLCATPAPLTAKDASETGSELRHRMSKLSIA